MKKSAPPDRSKAEALRSRIAGEVRFDAGSPSLEIVMTESPEPLRREIDKETGLALLRL